MKEGHKKPTESNEALQNFWLGAPKWFVNKMAFIIGRFLIVPFSNQKINFFEDFRIIATICV